MLTCRLCGRTLLPGERYRVFRGERSREHPVCALCREDALARHWLELDGPPARVRVHDLAQTVRKAA